MPGGILVQSLEKSGVSGTSAKVGFIYGYRDTIIEPTGIMQDVEDEMQKKC